MAEILDIGKRKAEEEKQERARRYLEEKAFLMSRRAIYEGTWERIARRVFPPYATTFIGGGNQVPGSERAQEQFDVTAMNALWKFSAAMESFITPASSRWHGLRPMDKMLLQHRDARAWYEEMNETLFYYRYAMSAGFQGQQHDGYTSLGAFGNSILFIDRFRDSTQPFVKGVRYRQVPLGECYMGTNHQGIVDRIFRRFKMTWEQMVDRFGMDNLPENVRETVKDKPNEEQVVIHAVRPNRDFIVGSWGKSQRRFVSCYILEQSKHILEESGYYTFPYAVGRYLTAPGEAYGRGPAGLVLPGINVLNEEKKIMLKQGHRSVDPVLLVHDDGILDDIALTPGAAVPGAIDDKGHPLVQPLPVGNLAIGKELMDDERFAINDVFLVTLFQILIDQPRMSATEVLERAREKGALMSPTMGRFQADSCGQQILRELDVLAQLGVLPPPPSIVREAGAYYRVEYDAPLNRYMKMEEAAGAMRAIQTTGELVAQTQDPSLMDNFNLDVAIPDMSMTMGMPVRYLATEEEKAAKRQARNADKQTQQLTQALPGVAAMAKAYAPQGAAPEGGQQ